MAEIIPRIAVTASTYGPQYTAPDGTVYYLDYMDGIIRIPMTTAAFTAATVSTTGAPTITNTVTSAWIQLISSSAAQAALIRQFANLSGSVNWLPGPINQIDWDKEWILEFTVACDIGGTGSGFKWTLFIGGLSAAPSGHTMTAKGVNFCVLGTGTDAGTVQIGAHNGTTQTNSSTSAQTLNGRSIAFKVHYLPGQGAFLFANGNLVASLASSSLPTGLGAGSANGWAFLMEHTTATNGIGQVNISNMAVRF